MWVNAWAYMRMDKQQRWWNFEWNFADTVQNQINLPEKVIIKDDTLREGEETPGAYFTIDQKIEIAKLLEEMGIPEIEVGYAAGIKEHADTFKALKKEGIKMKLSSHARLYVEDVKKEVDDILAAEADHIRQFRWKPTYHNHNWTLLLLPIYTTYYLDDDGAPQVVLLHGQTGKVNGDRKASMKRARRISLMIVIAAIVIFLLSLVVAIGSMFLQPLIILGGVGFLLSILLVIMAVIPVGLVWQFNRRAST